VPSPSAGGLAHSRAIHARDPLDIDLFRRVRNRPAARVPYPVGTCESVQQAGGQRPRHQPPDGDRRGRGISSRSSSDRRSSERSRGVGLLPP
jgi:hypothetical protein